MSLAPADVGNAAPTAAAGDPPVADLYLKLTVAAAVFFIMLEVLYLILAGVPPLAKPWPDATGYVLGRDFLNTWMGSRSFFAGGPAAWFDVHAYNAALRDLFGAPYPELYWSYPPHIVLLTWPFGLLPYLPAYLLWCTIGIALYLFASSHAMSREYLPFLAFAPAVAVCLFFGQNGFYTAALLIGGLLCLDRRPVLAGVLFGMLTVKPQLGLLLPVVLLLERRWTTIASALATAAFLVVVTGLRFGWDIWIAFWQKTVPQQVLLTQHSGPLLLLIVPSTLYGARLVHLPENVAWTLQAIVAALALAAVVWAYWRRRDPALSLALLVTAIFLVTPYIVNYDMVVLAFVTGLLRGRADNTPVDHWLLIAIWTLPFTMIIAALAFIPLAPIVLIGFASRLVWRLARTDRNRACGAPPNSATVFA